MSDISTKNVAKEINDGDLFLVYLARGGVTRRVSASSMGDYFRGVFGADNKKALEIPRRALAQSLTSAGHDVIWFDPGVTATPDRVPIVFNGSSITPGATTDILFDIPDNPAFSHINLYLSCTIAMTFGAAMVGIYKDGAFLQHNGREIRSLHATTGYKPFVVRELGIPVSGGEQFKLRFEEPVGESGGSGTAITTGNGITGNEAAMDYLRVEEVYS